MLEEWQQQGLDQESKAETVAILTANESENEEEGGDEGEVAEPPNKRQK